MPRRNRVDPFGDLHAVTDRGMFTGNRGCLVNEVGQIVRHHSGSLWITCVVEYKDWRSPLAAPRHWTPLFFLDDAVALAAGHRPCGLCRRDAYLAYKMAVMQARSLTKAPSASDLNRQLAAERLAAGRGIDRASERRIWRQEIDDLPSGSVILQGDQLSPHLVLSDRLMQFGFEGWTAPRNRPTNETVSVLTPPTSVAALSHGFTPALHASAGI